MTEPKTKQNDADVYQFLESIEDSQKYNDSLKLLEIMEKLTGQKPKMWGKTIIGFDTYTMTYASGKKAEWMVVGFSPRKQNISIYIMSGFEIFKQEELDNLGKHKTSKGCLYIKRLDDIDQIALENIIKKSIKHMRDTSH